VETPAARSVPVPPFGSPPGHTPSTAPDLSLVDDVDVALHPPGFLDRHGAYAAG
jgi:hypothetical protein